jgi:hypothetical protein
MSSLDPPSASSSQARAARNKHLLSHRGRTEDKSARTSSQLRPPSPSQSRPRSTSRTGNAYDYLYTPKAAAELVNFVDFLGQEDVTIEKEVLLSKEKFLGAGSMMEVHVEKWKNDVVAVKTLKEERKPVRHTNLKLEEDTEYRERIGDFYTDVENIMQEVLVMSRVLL